MDSSTSQGSARVKTISFLLGQTALGSHLEQNHSTFSSKSTHGGQSDQCVYEMMHGLLCDCGFLYADARHEQQLLARSAWCPTAY
jgi:hypothetical protein